MALRSTSRSMVLAVVAMIMVACGIDESGLLGDEAGSGDATGGDASKDVVSELPQSCATLDVSACVDSGIPDGWSPVVTTDAGNCPTTNDYIASAYVDNLDASGPCTCGCKGTGTIACTGTLAWASNHDCTFSSGDAVIDGGGPGCYSGVGGDSLSIHNLSLSAKGANVGCDASAASMPSVTTTPVTVCAPKCSADYCGASGGFRRCIWSTTQTSCPSPFINQDTLGKDTDTAVSCGCTCTARQVGTCTAAVLLYNGSSTCGNTPFNDAAIPPQACIDNFGTNVDSFAYVPGPPPTVGCVVDGGRSPTVTFGSTRATVCCL